MYVSQRRDLLLELAHTVMKAEKFHNLLSANWRIRRVSGVGLRTRGAAGVTRSLKPVGMRTQVGCWLGPGIWRPKNQVQECSNAKEMDVPAQEEREFALFSPFCSMQDASGLYKAHPCWGRPLSWCTETNVSTPFGNTLTDTLRSNILSAIWATCRPGKLTHNINHHIGS